MARIVELILTDDLRGKGIEGDPYRRVTQLWSKNGVLLAEYDPSPSAPRPAEPVSPGSWFDPGSYLPQAGE